LLAARKAVEKLKTIERMTSNFMEQPIVAQPIERGKGKQL